MRPISIGMIALSGLGLLALCHGTLVARSASDLENPIEATGGSVAPGKQVRHIVNFMRSLGGGN